jgi:hypothetical protein
MKRAAPIPVLLLLAGCFHDSAAPVPPTIHGRWVLKTMDGAPVPQVYAEVSNFKVEIVRGTLVLREDNTFSDTTDIRRTENQLLRRVIDVAEGNWFQVADTLKLNSTRGERYFMIFSNQSLRQNLGGRILLYKR